MRLTYLLILILVLTEFLSAQLNKPGFSKERGFYETAFNVIISNDLPGSYIRYTLDGSDPVTSNTAFTSIQPVTVNVNPESTAGRARTPGVVLRACSAKGNETSKSVTHTYLFLNKIGELSPENVRPNSLWPAPNENPSYQYINYGMDPSVLNDERYKGLIDDAMLAIPTVSIVTDMKNLFSPADGIYMNAMNEGEEWERPASLELLNPDGSEGFQVNAGIRIRGGYSRNKFNPKHAFRFFFRSIYGEGKLKYPLFGNEGVKEFDKIDFRTGQNYSWSFPGHQGEYNTMNRDVFSRDMQREMGQPYTRSRYYHLYINGYYWGLYQSQERSEARFAASYFGGEPEDYDVIKDEDGSVSATDGNDNIWERIYKYSLTGFSSNGVYFGIQGKNQDGTVNPGLPVLVDVNNLIDYMLVIFFTGNFDAPTSMWGGNKTGKNYYCIYNRNGKEGFKFFSHDAENSLRTTPGENWDAKGLTEDRVNIGTWTNEYQMKVDSYNQFHPQWLHFKLSANPEYRMLFADHVYKHFFNNGVMTPAKAAELFLKRTEEIELAIIGESARWGNTYYEQAKTKDDWQWAVDDIVYNYFPYRTNIVLGQLKTAKLYPGINSPVFGSKNKLLNERVVVTEAGFSLNIGNPNSSGAIYYTMDNSDPRAIGGAVNGSAKEISESIELVIDKTTIVKARIKDGDTWSALHEITLLANADYENLKLTEIHYHPLDADTINDDEFEFIELKNTGVNTVALSQAYFENGFTYVFPAGTVLDAGKFIVLASNADEFKNRYGFSPFGKWSGKLDNGGERITLCTAAGDTVFSVLYDDAPPWPEAADGEGYSLVIRNQTENLNDPANWRASNNIHGSPGEDDGQSTAVKENQYIQPAFGLAQNYPNPFNPSTNFKFAVSEPGHVTLKIYDMLGRETAVLVSKYIKAGEYNVSFNAAGLSSGIYIARLQSGIQQSVRKIMLVK
jgi:hypothetical protein